MLDRDLANLYGVETRGLNQAVRRKLERFPDDFIFSLTRQGCPARAGGPTIAAKMLLAQPAVHCQTPS
jgi:hypothetical protein